RIADWRDTEMRRAARAVASLFKAVSRPPVPDRTPPLPEGEYQYRAILADPPWRFQTWGMGGMDRAPDQHYATMDTAAICALPVDTIAAFSSCLFLWVYSPMLPEALEVIRHWGFQYRTVAFVCSKAEDGEPPIGGGYWTRAQAEICLLATRGQP